MIISRDSDIYDYGERSLMKDIQSQKKVIDTTKHGKALHKALSEGVITSEECRMIQAFIGETSANAGVNGITDSRKSVIVLAILAIRPYMNMNFEDVTTEEIYSAIENYKNVTQHEASTQQTYLISFKQFLTWLIDTEQNTNLKPTRIVKINTRMPMSLKTAEDILNGDELERVFKAAKNLRDRAFIEVLYDSAGRINEVITLKWSQIEFFDSHAVITVQSKTEYPRKIPLYTSHTTLKQWHYQYPNGAQPDDCVFFGRASKKSEGMKYGNALALVKAAAKGAGIEKRVTPHTFRHTRITDLMRMGIPEQTIKMIAWGNVTSDMLKVYAHLTPTDAVNDLNKHMGIDTGNKIQPLADIVTPAQCPRCGTINSKLNPYCGICGAAMSKVVDEEYERKLAFVRDTDLYKRYVSKMEALDEEFMDEVDNEMKMRGGA